MLETEETIKFSVSFVKNQMFPSFWFRHDGFEFKKIEKKKTKRREKTNFYDLILSSTVTCFFFCYFCSH